MNGSAVLRVVQASKSFGATQAVRDVSLEVGPGEVVALVGENGAGKSTLIRLISGELAADSGEVWVGGRSLTADPHLARKSGVAVIHQELSYVPTMTVAENLMLARMPRRRLRWLVDRRRLLSSAAAAIRTIDDTIRLDAQMSDLTVGNRQVVEIARAVGAEPDLLLLDEPTAALDAREVDRLFAVIRSLRAQGIGMIYVSHRLAELELIADRFVVMRDGAVVATHEEVVDRDRLVGEIVGRQLSARVPHALAGDTTAGDVGLAVDLTTDGALRQLTFHARKGQAIGLYGLPGSGVESVARAIVGDISTGGSIQIGNVKLGPRRTPRQCCRAGIAHVPSDRRGEGLFAELPMRTNISIGALAMRSPWRFLTRSAEDAAAGPLAKRGRCSSSPTGRSRGRTLWGQPTEGDVRPLAGNPAASDGPRPTDPRRRRRRQGTDLRSHRRPAIGRRRGGRDLTRTRRVDSGLRRDRRPAQRRDRRVSPRRRTSRRKNSWRWR